MLLEFCVAPLEASEMLFVAPMGLYNSCL
jgi:hypothetical protein